jgi:hypothetical protein
MHKHCLLILLLGLTRPAFGQGAATVYIPEVDKSGQVVSSKLVNGETINRVIALPDGYAYKYGAWQFYHPNGALKSEGFFALVPNDSPRRHCGPASLNDPKPRDYHEKRVGRWEYWDENGKPRVDLDAEEVAYDGFYRQFTDSHLLQEGVFAGGKLVEGFYNVYDFKRDESNPPYFMTFTLIKTRYFEHGRCVREEQKYLP